jgi:hypothetical protein
MTKDFYAGRTISGRGLVTVLKSRKPRRGHIAGWLAFWWDFLLGK